MKFSLEVKMDNAAFTDYPGTELRRILADLIERVTPANGSGGAIMDINGNRVGDWQVAEESGNPEHVSMLEELIEHLDDAQAQADNLLTQMRR